MAVKTLRKIVKIDEEKCNGCGVCVPSCAEGALRIIDGKARLISERYCDGLGACLGECPQDAISIVEEKAQAFDEEAVKVHLEHKTEEKLPCGCPSASVQEFKKEKTAEKIPCGCPSTSVKQFHSEPAGCTCHTVSQPSTLTHFPLKLQLVPAKASFLAGADVLLTADCVPFCYGGFHQDFLKGHALLTACPKLDDFEAHQAKLTEILRQAQLKSLTVVHMEVPCCSGLVHMAKQAISASGKDVPFKEITISVRGERLPSK